jgi:hypothetical protein
MKNCEGCGGHIIAGDEWECACGFGPLCEECYQDHEFDCYECFDDYDDCDPEDDSEGDYEL